jgi:hypothetical protein
MKRKRPTTNCHRPAAQPIFLIFFITFLPEKIKQIGWAAGSTVVIGITAKNDGPKVCPTIFRVLNGANGPADEAADMTAAEVVES